MTPVFVSPTAQRDIEDIALAIASANPRAADRWVGLLERAFDMLEFAPDAGRPRDEIRSGYRSVALRNYVVFYQHRDEIVEVLRVLDGRRDIDAIFQSE